MASAGEVTIVTAKYVPGKIRRDHLICCICSNLFMEPKVLNCLHSFCLKCLQELRHCQDPSSAKLLCPLCGQETTVTDQIDALPDDFLTSALLEEFLVQEQLLKGQGSEIKCQACVEGEQAVSRCMECDHFLCEECHRAHQRLTLMKSHKIATLAQLRSGEMAYKSKLREEVTKCGGHPNENLNIYCNTCQHLVCTTCSVLEHGKHSLIGLATALKECKQDIAEQTSKVKQNMTELCAAKAKTRQTHRRLDVMFAKTNKKISLKADTEVAKIRKKEQKLKQEAVNIYSDRVETCQMAQDTNGKMATQAEHKLDRVNRLMTQGNSGWILNLKHKLLHNLKQLTGRQAENVPESLSIMDFEEVDDGTLGRLVLEDEEDEPEAVGTAEGDESPKSKGKWRLKAQIKNFKNKEPSGCEAHNTDFKGACDVAAFSNNDVIIADKTHKQLIRYSSAPNPHSFAISKRMQLTDPSHVSVNKDDQIIVLDGPEVKTFNMACQLLFQFTPGQEANSTPTCLAVDERNLIAVGYREKDEVSLYTPQGNLIRTLPAPMIDSNLTTWKQRLVYTNTEAKKLLAVGYDGIRVFTENIRSKVIIGPTGVCSGSDGSLYVAVHGHFLISAIQHFSPDGEYKGCVIKRRSSPYGITSTPAGELVVAAGRSVLIYKRAGYSTVEWDI